MRRSSLCLSTCEYRKNKTFPFDACLKIIPMAFLRLASALGSPRYIEERESLQWLYYATNRFIFHNGLIKFAPLERRLKKILTEKSRKP